MRRRKGAAEAEGGGEVPDELRCRRSDGRGWRCPGPAMAGASFCKKHILQRLRYQAQKKPQKTLNGGKKQQLKRPRVENTLSPCRNKRSTPVKVVNEQEKQRTKTEAHSTTGKRKISEDMDCSSRSTTTEKETNFTAAFEVDDVASHSTRQTNGKFRDREIGRYLRKYLASGVMEIALDYDSDYDFRKVAGLELSQ